MPHISHRSFRLTEPEKAALPDGKKFKRRPCYIAIAIHYTSVLLGVVVSFTMCVFPPSIIQIFDSDERKVDISFGIALSMALVAKHVSEAIFRHLLPRFGLLSEEEANDYYSYVYEGEFPDSYLGETKTDMT